MSDLSRLNPKPHAIAVYASQPLSPGATQHSLPSGRYSLLGPDFHRLDRTSLRLAHSLLSHSQLWWRTQSRYPHSKALQSRSGAFWETRPPLTDAVPLAASLGSRRVVP